MVLVVAVVVVVVVLLLVVVVVAIVGTTRICWLMLRDAGMIMKWMGMP